MRRPDLYIDGRLIFDPIVPVLNEYDLISGSGVTLTHEISRAEKRLNITFTSTGGGGGGGVLDLDEGDSSTVYAFGDLDLEEGDST